MGARRTAVRSLGRLAEQSTVDYLCSMLVVEEEVGLRYEVAMELVKLRVGNRRLQFPLPLVRRQMDREVESCRRIRRVKAVYKLHHPDVGVEDPIFRLLRVLEDEAVEQVFRLLMLVYRPEDIHLVFEQMSAPDVHLRADAIELLDNLVDPVVRRTLLPLIEDESHEEIDAALAAQHYDVLQQAIWDHHCWLSVATVCAVGCMRLTSLRRDLERAAGRGPSVLSEAARIALDLAEAT